MAKIPYWQSQAKDKLDLLERVSMIDNSDLVFMLQYFNFETVESEITRALTTLEELRLSLVETYNKVINEK